MTKEWFSAAELVGTTGLPSTPQNIKSKAKREGWQSRPRKGRGGGSEYHISGLPIETQAALLVGNSCQVTPGNPVATGDMETPEATPFTYDRDSLWGNFERQTDKKKQTAKRKHELLLMVMTLADNGTHLASAFQAIARAENVSWRTMQGWYHGTSCKPGIKHYERQDWLAALIPSHTGRTKEAEICEEAWDLFKADYLRNEKPTTAQCYRRLERIAAEHAWQLPSLRTLERKINRDIPRTIRVLLRDGEEKLRSLYPAQERSVRELHALEWINGDGYQHNVFVKWPNGSIERPKTWFWQDIYSRKLLAFRVDSTEHTDLIRISFGDLVETYGIPEHATIDNTRAAANKWMTGGVPNRYRFKVKEDDPLGLFPSLGVQVHWTSVYNGKGHGQAKPVERAFGVGGIGEVVDKHPAFAGAYTGHNPTAKPENYGSKAVPIETFLQILQEEVTAWNARPKRRTEVCGGVHSYDQAFEQSFVKAPICSATDEQRRLWLLSAESILVRNDGTFTLDAGSAVGQGRNRYKSHNLIDHAGQKVVVRFDPQDLHEDVFVYTLDGRYIDRAICIDSTGFGDTEAARAFNRARKQFVRNTKLAAEAESRMDVMDAARRLPSITDYDPPEAKVVRPLRPDPEQHRPAPPPPMSPEERQRIEAFQSSFQDKAEVLEIQDPRRRHAFWLNIRDRLERGEEVPEENRKGWEIYRNSEQYTSQQRLFEAFGLKTESFQ